MDSAPTDELTTRIRAEAGQLDMNTRLITLDDIEARLGATTIPRSSRPTARARAAVAITVAAALTVAVAVALSVARQHDTGARRLRISNETPAPSRSASESVHPEPRRGLLLYLAPSNVPAGFSAVEARIASGNGGHAGSPETTAAQFWVRFNTARDAADATLDIQWGPGSRAVPVPGHPASPDPLRGLRQESQPVTVRGRSGLYVPRLGGVAWEEPVGQAVGVYCERCPRDELVQIADQLVARTDGGFTWPQPNHGFEYITQEPGWVSLGKDVRELTYRGPGDRGFTIAIADDSDEPPFAQLSFPTMQIVDVRGTHGILGPMMNAPITGDRATAFMTDPTLFVQWLEYPNVSVTVAGKNMSRSELLAIANSLREITDTKFDELERTAGTSGRR
jgi:hypothetical protein